RAGSSTCPATRRLWRRTRARWSMTATGSLRCAPSTCFLTLPTSSASRSWSVQMADGVVRARGFGVAAGLDPGVVQALGGHCAARGYRSLWSNDHPMASGLETAAQFAAAAPALDVGVAVLPLDRHEPAEIAGRMAELELDPGRL